MTSGRTTRVFPRSAERVIRERFGIINPVTDARRVLRGRQNTGIWLNARSLSIGASEVSVLTMADHPHHSRLSLWHVKRHGWGRFEYTPAQERGHWLEAGIASKFAAAHPELVVAKANGSLWADPNFPWITCSPDYLTIDADGLVTPLELKSDEGGDGWGWESEEIPAHHWWQANQQMGIFAAPHGHVARWSTRGYQDYLIEYQHPRYMAAVSLAREFLDEVATGKAPPPDGHRASTAVLKDEHPFPVLAVAPVEVPSDWGAELAALKTSRAEIDKQIKTLENQIRAAVGSAPYGYDRAGRTIHRTQTPRRAYAVKETIIDQIRINDPASKE